MKVLFLLLTLSTAHAQAGVPQITSGSCKLEQSKEEIVLKNVAPNLHFGMFAEGFSTSGDRVYLRTRYEGNFTIHLAGSSYAEFQLEEGRPTKVKAGAFLPRASGTEWLSCDLEVQEK